MRKVVLFVAASVAWSSFAWAQAEAPAAPLPPLPTAGAAPAAAAPPEPAPRPPPGTTPAAPAPGAAPPGAPEEPAEQGPAPASSRGTFIHRGFYLRVSGGAADVGVTGTAPGGGSASVAGLGSEFGIAIGGSPVPGLAIAFDVEGATVSGTFTGGPQVVATTTYPGSPSTTETLTGHAQAGHVLIGGLVDWFPNPRDGWHLGATVGLGGNMIADDAYHTMTSAALGLGASGGYDWWLGRAVSAGLDVFVSGALTASASDDNGNDTGYRLGSFAWGLGGQLLYY